MSSSRTQVPDMFMATTFMCQTQVLAYSRPAFATTVFQLPPGNPRRQQSVSSYAQECSFDRPVQSLSKTLQTNRTPSPEKLDYNDLMRKYRERLKQERKKHLKQMDERANYCIRGGQLHNRMNLKPSRNDSNMSCPKHGSDYEKYHRIISDIRSNRDVSHGIVQELGKLPFLRKRIPGRRRNPEPPIKPKMSTSPTHQRSKSCNRAAEDGLQFQNEAGLVPWRSINEQEDEATGYSPACFF